jgi:transposase
MAIADSNGFPVSICTESATPHEITLVNRTIEHLFTKNRPEWLIGDKAYDSDSLDEYLLEHYNIRLIAPHKVNRKKEKTQDGRSLRRYKKRWKIERLFSWFNNFRRLITRWEYHQENYLGFLLLACTIILLRRL